MINFSIIIPCFNSGGFVDVCLERLSLLRYCHNLSEVIFVDDCSTDNTLEVLNKYKETSELNIRIIRNKVNSGPGVSRHNAAEIASGEFLCFCDSDDWYDSDFLKDVNEELSRCESDLLIFDMSYVLNGKVIRKNYTAPFKYGDKMSYLSNCAESLCNLVVKRDLFLSIPIVDIRNGEDLALVPLLIANAKHVTHIDKSYYNYLMRSDSASLGRVAINSYNNMLLAFEHIRKHLKAESRDIEDCIEYLGIKTVLYNSTLMAIKGGNDNIILKKIVRDFTANFHGWSHNALKCKLGIAKNLYLSALKYKLWFICRVFVSLHTFLLTKR